MVAHTAPPGKLPSAANQVERFRWQHTPAPRQRFFVGSILFLNLLPGIRQLMDKPFRSKRFLLFFPVVRDVQPAHVIRPRSGNPDNQPIASVPSVKVSPNMTGLPSAQSICPFAIRFSRLHLRL